MRQLKITPSITNRDSKSVERYLVEISKYHPLSLEEELLCAEKIKNRQKPGSVTPPTPEEKEAEKYFEKLVNSNLRFAVSVAKQYQNSDVRFEDLINAGNEGVIKAAERFDATKGFKFISFAVWWIRQSIIKYIQENGRMVYLPANRTSSITTFKKFESKFVQEFEEKPNVDQIAEGLKITVEEAFFIVNLSEQTTFSIDKKINQQNDSEDTMEEFLEDNNAENNIYKNIFSESLSDDVLDAMSCLNEKERFVITKFFNLDRKNEDNMETIAVQISTTTERVRQIKDKALNKLRNNKTTKKLVCYL